MTIAPDNAIFGLTWPKIVSNEKRDADFMQFYP